MPTARSTRRSGRTSSSAALLAAALLACGGGEEPGPPPELGSGGGEAPAEERAPAPGPSTPAERGLAADATFADLLRAAQTLDDRRDTASDAGCLLGRGDDGWTLAADLAPAVRPLPEAPEDLDARLEAGVTPVTVLTRWGALGPGAPEAPSLAAVTTTLPLRDGATTVWFVTDRGVYVRSSAGGVGSVEPAERPSVEGAAALFVTAEAGVPLARLAEVLALAPEGLAGHVGLAATLAEGTRLPAPPAPAEAEGPAPCPDGLPPLAEEAPLGSIRPDVLVQSLGPLRQGAALCVSTAEGPGAAGGRVVLAMRIGPDGAVTDACVVEDETRDAGLRGCLARSARAIAFPAPRPAGYVDVQLPLVLAPDASQRPRALCR